MAAIDPGRHAVVEASAGTGKTYTLEQLVLQLLTAGQVPLDEILLVTYTDKATGELRGRLRAALEKKQAEAPEQRATLQIALDAFDKASICTIHGFCQRVLQEYAFENGQDFRSQLVHDKDLLPACLREVQRRVWRQDFGDRLPLILELAGYSQPRGAEQWEELVRRLAADFRPSCDHRFHPPLQQDWVSQLDEFEFRLRTEAPRLRGLAGETPRRDRPELHSWHIGFGQLNFRADWREPRRLGVLLPLLRWLADPDAAANPIAAFRRLLWHCSKASSFDKHGFTQLTAKLTAKAQAELPGRCPGLVEAVPILQDLAALHERLALADQLIVRTVCQLQDHLAELKRERGLQSFDDLLTRVDAALDPLRNPRAADLLRALRQRYRYAIVDEFQDTDPVQWRIFQSIFVTDADQHRLIVVGDPKQAIFGFRGADVHTFLHASQQLKEQHQAKEQNLDVNWRSCPDLLAALNRLFAAGGWFADSGIQYTEVQAPPAAQQPNRIVADRTGRAALTLVDVTDSETILGARADNARFIVAEIQRLLDYPAEAPALEFSIKNDLRMLKPDQICILVQKRKEATPVIDELRRARIPYSFHKQPGLWQSAEAVHLGYLLRALAAPDEAQSFRKALLTRFCRVRPEELARCDELPLNHRIHELFGHWRKFAQERRWGELFQALLEDTGILLVECRQPDAERRRANLQLVVQTLLQAAYLQDLDLPGLLEVFDDLRQRPGDEETDLQPVETEKPKVRILTIHAAKGLEFPIVFLAGGFTQRQSSDWYTYRDAATRQTVLDLEKGPEAKRLHDLERNAEDRRLLYVALTRAMFKLYVPRVAAEGKKYGSPGPIVKILAPAIDKSEVESLGQPLAEKVSALLVPASRPAQPTSAGPVEATFSPKVPLVPIVPPAELFPVLDTDLAKRRILIRSFTSLHREGVQSARESPMYAGHLPRADDDAVETLDEQTLLRGPVFGEIVHAVLERCDFAAVLAAADPMQLLDPHAANRTLIDEQLTLHLAELPALDDTAGADRCRQLIAGLVWHGLRTPVSALGVPLGAIPAADRLHELEFAFPEAVGPLPPEMRRQEGFLTGVMDLVVRHGGKFFLIDWKTNKLPAYTPEDLQRNMQECGYHLQYRLYLQALVRWLKRVRGKSFSFPRDFGGVCYLYLRGLNGLDDRTGVFFVRPTHDDLNLQRVLGG